MNKLCKHFSECGGCCFQDLPYQQQLANKESKLRALLDSSRLSAQLKPINYSYQWHYRNKMEFSFGQNQEVVCGLYSKKAKRKVVNIEECLIFSEDIALILKAIKNFVKKNHYSVYDKYSHRGFLRNVIVRQAKFRNQLMIGLVTTNSQEFKKKEFIEGLKKLNLKSSLKSIYRIINNSWSDAVVFEKKELLWGEPFIEEKLADFTFRISIDSFFQVNPQMLVNFYNRLTSYADLSGKERVLDLFCGLGSIGIWLSRKAKFVWGVEIVKEIVELAWENAKLNHIDNISFFVSDVRRFLNAHGAFYKGLDLLVINPPRSGLSQKIIRAIQRISPRTIIYSSCNPVAFFKDLAGLTDRYNLDFIEPFDFFPHTPHLECLSVLRKKM